MKTTSAFVVLFLIYLNPLVAQPATPASPADPHQPRPASPVVPDSLTPSFAPSSPTTETNNAASVPQVSVTVIADSSLRQVMQELAQSWADTQDASPQVPLTLTNAGTLRSKVETAPTWDIIICADIADMKEFSDRGVVLADGQRTLARNTLVVYGRKALVKDEDLDWFDLTGVEWKKVALGNPSLVASGRVAQRALEKHGLLDDDHKNGYTYTPTEAAAAGALQREQADAAFLYKTDLAKLNLPGFVIYPVKTDDAPPIFYIAAVGRLGKNPQLAHAFIDYCGSEAAKAIWAKNGFETN